MEMRRGRVLDVASLVKHMSDSGTQLGKRLHTAGEFPQAGIGHARLSGKETLYLPNGDQQALQVKQAFGRQECSWSGNLLEHHAQVKIIAQRELESRLDNRQELIGLFQPPQHLVTM